MSCEEQTEGLTENSSTSTEIAQGQDYVMSSPGTNYWTSQSQYKNTCLKFIRNFGCE